MPFHLVSYATRKYRHRQMILATSALANRVVASARSWNPQKLVDSGFLEIAPEISLTERGSGFWAWKPFVIQECLKTLPDGDVVLYCDAGRKYPYILLDHSLDPYLQWMDQHRQDIMPGVLVPWNGRMEQWTKQDAFTGTGMDNETIRNAPQIQASFSLWRNTPQTRAFVAQWLSWCVQRRLISDDPSHAANAVHFKAHRHDQSLLNLACCQHHLQGLDLGSTAPLFNERDPAHVAKQVLGAAKLQTFTGILIAGVSFFLQILEKAIRKFVTVGKTYA